jgi:hypothetical protein
LDKQKYKKNYLVRKIEEEEAEKLLKEYKYEDCEPERDTGRFDGLRFDSRERGEGFIR